MIKSQFVSVFLGFALLAMVIPCTASAQSDNEVDIVLEPGEVMAVVGEPFELTIKAIPNGQQLAAVDVFLDFNPAHLEVVDVHPDEPGIQIDPGATLATPLATKIDNSQGEITYCAGMPFGMASPDNTFTVATVRFQLKENATGTSEITFHTETPRQTMAAYKGNQVLGTLSGATVTVGSATAPSPAPAATPKPEPTPTPATPPVPPAPEATQSPLPTLVGLPWWLLAVIAVMVIGLIVFFVVKIRA